MKNTIKVFGIIAFVAVFTFSMASCSGGGKSLKSPEELKAYLEKKPANNPEKPIKVTMVINDKMLKDVAGVIQSAGKYVSLNLSGNALTTIPNRAFYQSEKLVSITIQNSVKNIEYLAFYGCTNLTSLIISDSVTKIDYKAFGRCTSLTSVTFQGTITSDELGKANEFGGGRNLPFDGDLIEKYLEGGIGKYTTTAPVDDNSKWTKK